MEHSTASARRTHELASQQCAGHPLTIVSLGSSKLSAIWPSAALKRAAATALQDEKENRVMLARPEIGSKDHRFIIRGRRRAVLERAGSREPANRGLAHTVGARQIGLHSAVSEPLEGLSA